MLCPRGFLFLSISLSVFLVACGDDGSAPAPGMDAGAMVDSGAADIASRDGGVTPDSGVDSSADAAFSDVPRVDSGLGTDAAIPDSGAIDAVADDAPSPPCRTSAECADTQYCAGVGCDSAGSCTARPRECPEIFAPVCSCDGVTFSNRCEASRAGSRVAADGMCPDSCELRPPSRCCYDNDDCGPAGATCRRARCAEGSAGICKASPDAIGECWTAADCAPGEGCTGASICPCGAMCFAADSPGTCS